MPENWRNLWSSPRVKVLGFVVWTIAFIELFVLIFMPSIRLWLAS